MEWDLHEKIPDLVPRLKAIVDRLEVQAKRMEELGRSSNDDHLRPSASSTPRCSR